MNTENAGDIFTLALCSPRTFISIEERHVNPDCRRMLKNRLIGFQMYLTLH